jgi:hypothetical protein
VKSSFLFNSENSVIHSYLYNYNNNYWLLLTGSGFQWYRTYERGYETSGSPLRFMLRRSSLVEYVSVLHGTGVYKASIFFSYFFYLLNLFWHTDKNCCFYAEVNFWDFVRNDNSNKGTTARLNETRFGTNKKSSPIYLGPKNLDTFWCTGWVWNCQIIFRCVSIHAHGFRVSVVSDVRERVQDFRITFALYVKKIFISWVC